MMEVFLTGDGALVAKREAKGREEDITFLSCRGYLGQEKGKSDYVSPDIGGAPIRWSRVTPLTRTSAVLSRPPAAGDV
jgi:hypothetical protein